MNKQAALVSVRRAEQPCSLPVVYHHELGGDQRPDYDAAVAGGKPRVRHGRGDLGDDLLVCFHFATRISTDFHGFAFSLLTIRLFSPFRFYEFRGAQRSVAMSLVLITRRER